jgi:hypothetical protein
MLILGWEGRIKKLFKKVARSQHLYAIVSNAEVIDAAKRLHSSVAQW